MITFKVASVDETKEFVRKAVDAKLHALRNGCLYFDYFFMLDTRKDKMYYGRPWGLIAMAFDEETPVGVCCLTRRTLSTYVRPAYRRQGIGKRLFEDLHVAYPIEGTYVLDDSTRAGKPFYRKLRPQACLALNGGRVPYLVNQNGKQNMTYKVNYEQRSDYAV